jgi:RimJ/RimL family protein N-acetyltransferase
MPGAARNEPFSLHTRRLALRVFSERDIPDLAELLSADDPRVQRVMGIAPKADAIRSYWEPMARLDPYSDPEWLSLLVEHRADKKVMGTVGFGVMVIDPQHKQGTIGWCLSPRFRGFGYATEAAGRLLDFLFADLELHRVSARTGHDNVRSWRLMERLGMRKEAHFREAHTALSNEWGDEVVYAVLRSEWAQPAHTR